MSTMMAAPVDTQSFSDLKPQEQITGEILGAGRGLADYLFPRDAEGNPLPFDRDLPGLYAPTMQDAPGLQEAIDAARQGLGQYSPYFQGGSDLITQGAEALGGAMPFAQAGFDAATQAGGRAEQSALAAQIQANQQAALGQGIASATLGRGTAAAQGASAREQAITQQAIQNALATQQRMSDLAGPGGTAAFMDPFQSAVIDDTLRKLTEQGLEAENRASAQAVQSGAFGGSRSGIQQAELGRRLQETKSDYLNQAMSQNFLQAQRAAQGAATLAQQGGGLAQQAYGTGSGRAIAGGQLGVGEAGQAGRIGLGIGELGGNMALQGGRLGAGTTISGGQLGLQGGQLGAQTATNVGRGFGAMGTGMAGIGEAGTQAMVRETQGLGRLGGTPLDILSQAGEVQRGNVMSDLYGPVRDFSILSDFYRGVPSSSALPAAQITTGQTNPFAGALGGGLAGLQVGSLFGRT